MPRITSRQHPLVQRCRRLASRRDPGTILLDGEHLIADALAAGLRFEAVLTDGRHGPLADRARAAGAAVHEATTAVLDAASPVQSPAGIVAIAAWRPLDLSAALAAGSPVIGLVGVQDPGNVGSVIRSADALGAGAVVLLDGSADPASWKALRGAMGSTFRVPIAQGTTAEAVRLSRARGLTVAAAVPHGGRALATVDLSAPVLVLFGGEGAGLTTPVVEDADLLVTIPMRAGVESLNIAVTAALVLWEARRPSTVARPTP